MRYSRTKKDISSGTHEMLGAFSAVHGLGEDTRVFIFAITGDTRLTGMSAP